MIRRALALVLLASALSYACADADLELVGKPPPDDPPPTQTLPEVDGGEDAKTPPAVGKTCGDKVIDDDEECDDGNNASNDGCSASCKRESGGPADLCPGVPIQLTGPDGGTKTGSVSGQTTALYPHYTGSCGGYQANDAVHSVTSATPGILRAKVTSAFDSVLYARLSCESASSESACKDKSGALGGDEITVTIAENAPVYLFVDGVAGASGAYALDVEVIPAACGNGIAEPPEQCDDGNAVAGDGCTPDCTLETVGHDIETCPGQGITLSGAGDAPRKVSLAGSTSLLPKTLSGMHGCNAHGPNAVYAITPDVDGAMTSRLVASYGNAVLHLRRECDAKGFHSQIDCQQSSAAAFDPVESVVPVKAGRPYYVIVDSYSEGFTGPYVLDVTVTKAVCGNGVLDGDEDCDDGNTAAGDGCSPTCKLEPVDPVVDFCSYIPLKLDPTGTTFSTSLTSSTASLTDHHRPRQWRNGCSPYILGKDATFRVVSSINGYLTATVSGTFDTMLYARSECFDNATDDLACSNLVAGAGPETISLPVEPGTTVALIVDSPVEHGEGVFKLDVMIKPSVCGNGVVEGGEQCDDGNLAPGDGCDATCALEPANSHDTCDNAEPVVLEPAAGGDYTASIVSGTTNLAHDQTFIGCASAGRDAIYTVTAPIDGVLTASVPSAGFNVSLGARSTCPTSTDASLPIVCSNASSDKGLEEISFGVTQGETYFLVVDGTAGNEFGPFTMNVRLRPPGCGDGIKSGSEACDDGNTTSGDGCSSTCTLETLGGIDSCAGFSMSLSGSGVEPRRGVVTVDTTTLAPNHGGSCGGSGKDAVVVVTPPIDGKLTAKLTGFEHHAVLYARTTCTDPKSEPQQLLSFPLPACDNDYPSPESAMREVTIAVKAGTPYYLFIDGYDGGAGLTRLDVTVAP